MVNPGITIPKRFKVSHEQFKQLAIVNRDLRLERTATGELIVMPPTGSETSNHNQDISGQLWLWNRQTKRARRLTLLEDFTYPMEPIALLMPLGSVEKDGKLSRLKSKKASLPYAPTLLWNCAPSLTTWNP